LESAVDLCAVVAVVVMVRVVVVVMALLDAGALPPSRRGDTRCRA
jgi:hypothetical protein